MTIKEVTKKQIVDEGQDFGNGAIYDDEQAEKADMRKEERSTRQWLIAELTKISGLWLAFTAIVVLCCGFRLLYFTLSDAVMISFLTTSLGTVLGLWGIGLRYYFASRRP